MRLLKASRTKLTENITLGPVTRATMRYLGDPTADKLILIDKYRVNEGVQYIYYHFHLIPAEPIFAKLDPPLKWPLLGAEH